MHLTMNRNNTNNMEFKRVHATELYRMNAHFNVKKKINKHNRNTYQPKTKIRKVTLKFVINAEAGFVKLRIDVKMKIWFYIGKQNFSHIVHCVVRLLFIVDSK